MKITERFVMFADAQSFQQFVSKHKYAVAAFGAALLIAIFAGGYVLNQKDKNANEASALMADIIRSLPYGQQSDQAGPQDLIDGHKKIDTLLEQYASTVYAPYAHIAKAITLTKEDKIDQAVEELSLALDEIRGKDELRSLVTIQLARLYASQKEYQKSLDVLAALSGKVFASAVFELQADAYFALGNFASAAEFYQKSLAEIDPSDPYTLILTAKINRAQTPAHRQ